MLALDVLQLAEQKLEAAKAALGKASEAVANFKGTEPAERARLELLRDEHLRRTQDEEKRYQIAKDLSDNLTVSYNTSEVIMARLMQTTNAKERVYAQAVTFFSTNDSVLTALKASFTGMFGLHESTQTLEVMKEGMSKSIEVLAEIGDQVGEAAVKAGYGPTIRADAVKKLVDSVVTFQERSLEIVQRDAQALDPELGRDPRRGRGRQAPHRPLGRGGRGAAGGEWLTTQPEWRGSPRSVRLAAAHRRAHAGDGRGRHPAPQQDLASASSTSRAARPSLSTACARSTAAKASGARPGAAGGCAGAQGKPLCLHAAAPGLRTSLAHCGSDGTDRQGLLRGVAAVALGMGRVSLRRRGAGRAPGVEQQRLELTDRLPPPWSRRTRRPLRGRVQPARDAAERDRGRRSRRAQPRRCGGGAGAISELETLRADLRREYTLRIVSRPNEPSGVWRIPRRNRSGRNYYLIVEPVAPDGQVLSLPVTSEEDGRELRPFTLGRPREQGRVRPGAARQERQRHHRQQPGRREAPR